MTPDMTPDRPPLRPRPPRRVCCCYRFCRVCQAVAAAVTIVTLVVTVMFVTSQYQNEVIPHVTYTADNATRLGRFPRKLHQVWIGWLESRPPPWEKAIKHCAALNKNYEYRLWTEKDIVELVTAEYPRLLRTYVSYQQLVQKTDLARYVILYHHGGVYLDMDIACRVPFDNILKDMQLFDTILAETNPFGVANDFIITKKHSRFMKQLIEKLPAFNRWYVLPYLTEMLATGPLFLSIHKALYDLQDTVYVASGKAYTRVWFGHLQGSTWHSWDGRLISFIYKLIGYIPVLFPWILVIGFMVCCVRLAKRKLFRKRD